MIQQVSVEGVSVTKKVVANSNRFRLLGIIGTKAKELNTSTEDLIGTLSKGNKTKTNPCENKTPNTPSPGR